MRLELQQIGALCVALLLGGFISIFLFLVMVFLIEPERNINSHMPRLYVVKLFPLEHENKTKKTPDKSIEIPKLSSNPELTAIRANVLRKVTRKKVSVRLPGIDQITVSDGGRIHVMNLHIQAGKIDYSKDSHNVRFSGVEKKYLTPSKEKAQVPERFPTVGGGEIDRIGNHCYEVSSVDGRGSSDTGQTTVEKDENRAMRSLSARQVPCNETNNSFAGNFLKQLEKRGLIMAPVSVTN